MTAADGAGPSRFRRASSGLLRDTTLDALRELLSTSEWSSITMSDVATAVGVSRQSLYKEFGSRKGLAHAYAVRLTDVLVSVVENALYQHRGDLAHALESGFAAFFELSGTDPLVMSLHQGKPPEDLLRLITTESDVIVEPASAALARALQESWVDATAHDADVAGTAVVRIALSYIGKPPVDLASTARGLAALLTPFLDAGRP